VRKIKFSTFLFLITLPFFVGNCSQQYDIVITGGMIYDGSGNTPYAANIGIRGGYIAAIGDIDASQGLSNINANGLYIAPGFIDVHTHCDRNLTNPELKSAKNYLLQGVTTVVTGNCGSGTFEVEKYFSTLEEQGVGPNVIHLIGHGRVRSEILGSANREPTAEELEKMKQLVAKGMTEGAVGLASGLFYAPGSFAKTDEVIELARTVSEYDGIYSSHIRDESNYSIGLRAAIEEAIEVGESAGVPVEISHIKALGKPVWGMAEEISTIIENARERGVKVFADQYPYVASSTGLAPAVIPRWVQAGGGMIDRLQDPELSERIKREVAENIDRRGGPETILISSYRTKPEWEGKYLSDISVELNKNAVDTAIELVINGGPGIISFNMQDADVEYFMQKPYVMTASDGSVPTFGRGVPHPRSYGTFTKKIRTYVIDKKIMSMEQVIRSSSAVPAELLDLQDRGMLKEGYAADIIVFDPNTITDKATFNDPHQYSEGIITLMVNGNIVIENGQYNGKLSGKPLRMNRN